MLYNIILGLSSSQKIEFGVNKDFVEKIVEAYWRGQSSVIIDGRSSQISEKNIQIYGIPSDLIYYKDDFEGFFSKASSKLFKVPVSEKIIANYCKNLTQDFLKGHSWGALKDDLYNVYLNLGNEKAIKLATEKEEILTFIHDLQIGRISGFIGGRNVLFADLKNFNIYDVALKHRRANTGETKKSIKEYIIHNHNGKPSTRVLEKLGKEVTSSFRIGAYGSKVQSTTPNLVALESHGSTTEKNKIFVSHSSKDKKIVEEFVNEILILCLGAESSKIFCTSIEGLGIMSGQDFRQQIKNELEKAQIVIQIISSHYKGSEVCLNEMGAAWVLTERVIPLIIDGKYDVGFIHSTTQQLRLTEKTDILQLIDDLSDLFPKKAKSAKIDVHVGKFLKVINPSHQTDQ